MSEKAFHLEIITPKRLIFSGKVLSFSAPGVVGGFQILRNHAAFLSSTKIGEIKLTEIDGKEHKYATSGGVVEVRDNNVIVLAETVESKDEIDVERASSAQERAQKRIHERTRETDLERARLAYQRAVNRLKIAKAK